ncbi:signal peptide peptidase SppA [Woodsholea maritima]|uniref:signal peptide peptidase SppA n=1 Tax=Woodsholea maritima TaxID=240237 RepID=UPI0003685E24|nr:signal peptide peptidase SppA [Woodsholea maritima]
MKQFWVTFFGSIVGVLIGSILTVVLAVFLIAGLISSAAMQASNAPAQISGPVVLELDLREARSDQPSRSPFAYTQPLSVVDTVLTLENAIEDNNVKGVLVRANEYGMSPASAEEIRTALAKVSASGKFVIAHAQGFEGTGVTNYFAVSGADEIWLQDTANFAAVGMATETMFLGGLFEHFGAVPQFVQFYEYKNAANVYTQSDFTEAHREATLSLLGSLFDTLVATSAQDRDQSESAMRNIIVNGPYSAEQAQQNGLVDQLGHVAAARHAARERAGKNAQIVDIETYASQQAAHSAHVSNLPVIALVEGEGAIMTGQSSAGGFSNQASIGGDTLAEAIDAAVEDKDVRVIILRVNSPGGSAIASDQIWDAVVRAREAGKPVIISMGSLAASGGYYIAAPADLIIANATTITGSIGMLSGKIVTDPALNRIGLNTESIHVGGDYATVYSSADLWTPEQAQAFYTLAEDVYEDFTQKVADGRDLPLAEVQNIARGRVWTGQQALEHGLVDRIGGISTAIEAAKEIANLDADDDVALRRFPRQLTPFEAFQSLFGASVEGAQSATELRQLMQLPEVQAALEMRNRMSQPGTQLYAPVDDVH